MSEYLELQVSGGSTLKLPVSSWDDGRMFVADQAASPHELDITAVRLHSDRLGHVVLFVLEAFHLIENEAGRWTITKLPPVSGKRQYDLEYYATEQWGQRVRNPAVMQWDSEKDEMTGA